MSYLPLHLEETIRGFATTSYLSLLFLWYFLCYSSCWSFQRISSIIWSGLLSTEFFRQTASCCCNKGSVGQKKVRFMGCLLLFLCQNVVEDLHFFATPHIMKIHFQLLSSLPFYSFFSSPLLRWSAFTSHSLFLLLVPWTGKHS